MKTLLIVEDHVIVREPLARLLRLEGYHTRSASNGVEGLAVLDSENVDLILLDLMMPKKDGVGFLESLRARPQAREIPVILLTGVLEGSLLDRARGLGVTGTVSKGRFCIEELFAKIRLAMEGERAA